MSRARDTYRAFCQYLVHLYQQNPTMRSADTLRISRTEFERQLALAHAAGFGAGQVAERQKSQASPELSVFERIFGPSVHRR